MKHDHMPLLNNLTTTWTAHLTTLTHTVGCHPGCVNAASLQVVSCLRRQVAGMLSEAQLTAPATNGNALPEPPGESSNSVLYVSGASLPSAWAHLALCYHVPTITK